MQYSHESDIYSFNFLSPGLLVIYWIHDQHQLDIVVNLVPASTFISLISICMLVRNKELNFRAWIEAILAQTYPAFKLIALDDRSIDTISTIILVVESDLRAGFKLERAKIQSRMIIPN